MEIETLTSLWGHRWVHALSLLADAVMMPLRLVKLSGFGVDEVWQWLNLRDLTIIQMGLHFITAQRYHILSTFYRLKRIYYKKRFMLHCTSLWHFHTRLLKELRGPLQIVKLRSRRAILYPVWCLFMKLKTLIIKWYWCCKSMLRFLTSDQSSHPISL